MTRFTGEPMDHDATDAAEEESATTMSLSSIGRPEEIPEAADLEVESLKGPSKLLGQGTLLLVVVAAIAAGSLYAMRQSKLDMTPTAAAREIERRIEDTLAKLSRPDALASSDPLHQANLDSLFRDTESVVRVLAEDHTQLQVPVEYVKKNPFELAIYKPVQEAAPVQTNRGAAERLRQLNSEFSRLKLQTVMRGRPNIAVINGEFYREGQQVGSFTIRKIDGFAVELVADGNEFQLTMDSSAR